MAPPKARSLPSWIKKQAPGVDPVRLNVGGDFALTSGNYLPRSSQLGSENVPDSIRAALESIEVPEAPKGERQLELPLVPDRSRPLYQFPVPLDEALRLAAERGVPWGYNIAIRNDWHGLDPSKVAQEIMQSPDRDRVIRDLHALLTDSGIPADRLIPHSKGAFSTAFVSPDTNEIVKLTLDGKSQYPTTMRDVWGILTPRVAEDVPVPYSAYLPGQLAAGIYPKALLGQGTNADKMGLRFGLQKQGFDWHDDHDGNWAMLPGKEWRPVVIDGGSVSVGTDKVRWPLKLPTGPIYNWLIPALAAGGASAVATAGQPLATESATIGKTRPVPPPEGASPQGWFDFSMSISPDEWKNWETVPSYGYGGKEHNAYVDAVNQALDVPSIPEKFVAANLPKGDKWPQFFPGYKGGDMTMRQMLTGLPWVMQRQAIVALALNPNDEEAKQQIKYFQNAEQVQADVHAALTGSAHPRGNPYIQGAVNTLLGAIKSGTPGGEFEDDPARTQAEFDALKQKNGDQANFMLTPGGENNHRRQAVYELASALQDGEHTPSGVTTTQAIGNLVAGAFDTPGLGGATDRFYDLTNKSAPLGRINMALEKWGANRNGIVRDSQTDDTPPAVVSGRTSEQYDPRTWNGFFKRLYNPAYPAGRNIAGAITPWASNIGTTLSLVPEAVSKEGPAGVLKPFAMQTDLANRADGVTPVIPGNMTRDEFRGLLRDRKDLNNAMTGWTAANIAPAMQEMHGKKRAYTPPWMQTLSETPQGIASDPYAATAVLAGARAFGQPVLHAIGEEVSEDLAYGPGMLALESGSLAQGVHGMVAPPENSPYLLPRPDNSPVKAEDEDYWEQLRRSREHWGKKATDIFRLWDGGSSRPREISGVPKMNAG